VILAFMRVGEQAIDEELAQIRSRGIRHRTRRPRNAAQSRACYGTLVSPAVQAQRTPARGAVCSTVTRSLTNSRAAALAAGRRAGTHADLPATSRPAACSPSRC
jgi:hypothetical protein